MGEEIATHSFTRADFDRYHARLVRETALLGEWLGRGRFPPCRPVGGYEVETCLVDARGRPAPVNDRFLARVGREDIVPELARFNVEINTPPRLLEGQALRRMEDDLRETWKHCSAVAREIDAEMLMIGILPTLTEDDLTLANMSRQERYRALNEQVFRLRHGRPIALDIEGEEHLRTRHRDVMLESAATSFQIHVQVSPGRAAHLYNLAVVLSAPMVAVSANSPYLFGRDLWDETRIPLFEQSVEVADGRRAAARVTLGRDYVHGSLIECFEENVQDYAVLLPVLKDEAPDRFVHVRLHNGTIWRWNRPLVGFDAEGRPHLRIEHRVVPAGPSIADTIANAALFFGLIEGLRGREPPLYAAIPFADARANFYAAARHGLRAEVSWAGGRKAPLRALLREELLPRAREGLAALGLAAADIEDYLGVIEARLATGRNGAAWQRAFVACHGRDMQALTLAYLERQRSGAPVHEWAL
ncbi:glutamate--cysteine ligase [Sulfurifustis variabilis]|uniref:Glutamate--cysteine ligase n=1 Tax=Sulfurifustis variabilis TaxID=1675686 RepID=A0A1B4V7E9_9GAMM|nr:glutamate-cysteine ligase family protein [Sulfurifustis variabilis]BAU49466.1 glutamate--cysteine ligase [Sulfurifustis variabilis]